MKFRRLWSGATTVAAALSLAAGVTTPAHAAVTKFCTAPANKAGEACFYSDGDKITVRDIWKDGLRSVAVWFVEDRDSGYKRQGECHNAGGAGTVVTCDYDFMEGPRVVVTFWIQARDGANGSPQYEDGPVIGWVSGR